MLFAAYVATSASDLHFLDLDWRLLTCDAHRGDLCSHFSLYLLILVFDLVDHLIALNWAHQSLDMLRISLHLFFVWQLSDVISKLILLRRFFFEHRCQILQRS